MQMRRLTLWSFLLLTTCGGVLAKSLNMEEHSTNIEKRQICSNSGCGTCDGKTCNVCSNTDTCCNSVTCNKCVNQCANNCNTPTCNNNCVSGCASTCQTPSCQIQSCSQCVNKCANQCSNDQCVNNCSKTCENNCQSQTCSQCTNKCSNQCSNNEQCANNCVKSCDCKQTEVEPPVIIEQPQQPTSVIVNNTNNNLVNLTTHINIDNIVNNYNNISVPIFVNTTNINNIDLTDIENKSEGGTVLHGNGSGGGGGGFIPYPYPYPIYPPAPVPTPNENCCYVMHPRRCYTDEEGDRRCYIRRHRECSDYCTSPIVTIQEDPAAINSGCYRVPNYPYVYCGNYVRRDCGQCFTCNGAYNPSECLRTSECGDVCRRSVPNCVPSQSGLQCY